MRALACTPPTVKLAIQVPCTFTPLPLPLAARLTAAIFALQKPSQSVPEKEPTIERKPSSLVAVPVNVPGQGLVSVTVNERTPPDTVPVTPPLPNPIIAKVPVTLAPLCTSEKVAELFPMPGMAVVPYQVPVMTLSPSA
jgi:hypothetical protein